MPSQLLAIATLVLAVSASPVVVVRDENPKPAISGLGGFGGFGKGKGSSSSSTGGGFDALSNLGMMSSSDVKKGTFDCKNAALLFARGTGEPGNMGYVVGPPLGGGLKKALNGDILIQGVDYSTNFSGGGAREMVTLVKSLMAKCAKIKIILGGYSQGAMQVHQALGSLGPIASNISVAVTFGDPYSSQGWGTGGVVGSVMGLGGSGGAKPAGASGGGVNGFNPNNGLIICSNGDFVCGVVPNIGGAVPKATASDTSAGRAGAGHLSYSTDGSIQKAINFIVARVSDKGASPASGESEKEKSKPAAAKPKSATPAKEKPSTPAKEKPPTPAKEEPPQ